MTGRIVFRNSWHKRRKKKDPPVGGAAKIVRAPRKKRRKPRQRHPSDKKLLANLVEAASELVEAIEEEMANIKTPKPHRKK